MDPLAYLLFRLPIRHSLKIFVYTVKFEPENLSWTTPSNHPVCFVKLFLERCNFGPRCREGNTVGEVGGPNIEQPLLSRTSGFS